MESLLVVVDPDALDNGGSGNDGGAGGSGGGGKGGSEPACASLTWICGKTWHWIWWRWWRWHRF